MTKQQAEKAIERIQRNPQRFRADKSCYCTLAPGSTRTEDQTCQPCLDAHALAAVLTLARKALAEPRYALEGQPRRVLQMLLDEEREKRGNNAVAIALTAALALEEPFTGDELEVVWENLICRNPTSSKHGNDPCEKCPECSLSARLDAMLERSAPGDDALQSAKQFSKP